LRCLARNKRPFWYARYADRVEIVDEQGRRTGQYRVSYSKPVKLMGNISAAKGESSTRQFGDDESYDKVIVISDPNTAIDENSVLWVETEPTLNKQKELMLDEHGNILTPHNYIVRQVARGLDSASIAIGKVNVRG
jgi:hypothetical protein